MSLSILYRQAVERETKEAIKRSKQARKFREIRRVRTEAIKRTQERNRRTPKKERQKEKTKVIQLNLFNQSGSSPLFYFKAMKIIRYFNGIWKDMQTVYHTMFDGEMRFMKPFFLLCIIALLVEGFLGVQRLIEWLGGTQFESRW